MRIVLSLVVVIAFGMPRASVSKDELVGAGATFPYPLYSKMFDAYYQQYGLRINYQAIGSGGGIRQLRARTVDFGATDAYMSDEEMEAMPAEILHVPTCVGAVVVTYNLAGRDSIKFEPDILAGIFLGKITNWSDPKIRAANPEIDLPDIPVMVVHRSDGSGTTAIFTDYLSKISKIWRKIVGSGKAVRWPCGLGAKGNAGVAGLINQIPGSIGYVELAYCAQNKMPVAAIRNQSGNFVFPSIESVTLAANIDLPDDTRISITDTPAELGYPISGFTWLIVFREQAYADRSKARAQSLAKLIWWMLHEGQRFCSPLEYAPLPEDAVKKAEKMVMSMVFDGRPLIEKREKDKN